MTASRFRHWRAGRWQVWRGMGVLLCLDRFTGPAVRGAVSWRVLLSRHPVWLPFSERNGHRPGPRIIRLGRYDVAVYSPTGGTR